jgi:hypothetical protein
LTSLVRARSLQFVSSLLLDLDAFYQEHRRCGDLEGAVEGDRVWMTCYVRSGHQPAPQDD